MKIKIQLIRIYWNVVKIMLKGKFIALIEVLGKTEDLKSIICASTSENQKKKKIKSKVRRRKKKQSRKWKIKIRAQNEQIEKRIHAVKSMKAEASSLKKNQ